MRTHLRRTEEVGAIDGDHIPVLPLSVLDPGQTGGHRERPETDRRTQREARDRREDMERGEGRGGEMNQIVRKNKHSRAGQHRTQPGYVSAETPFHVVELQMRRLEKSGRHLYIAKIENIS